MGGSRPGMGILWGMPGFAAGLGTPACGGVHGRLDAEEPSPLRGAGPLDPALCRAPADGAEAADAWPADPDARLFAASSASRSGWPYAGPLRITLPSQSRAQQI